MEQVTKREPLRRLSISLPESLCQQFEKLVDRRGFRSRSQAIASMITSSLAEYEDEETDTDTVDGIAALVLGYTAPGSRLLLEMAALNKLFRANIVSSSRRLFANDFTVEVILLQGSKSIIADVADQFSTLRGMHSGKLSFV